MALKRLRRIPLTGGTFSILLFYLTVHPIRQGLLLLSMFNSEDGSTFKYSSRARIRKRTFKSSLKKSSSRYWDLIKQYKAPTLPNITRCFVGWPYTVTSSIDQTLHQAKQKYRGMFETQKSRNKTSSGDIGLNIRTLASPKQGQDQVSGGVSVLCWHAAPVANVLWKPLAIR